MLTVENLYKLYQVGKTKYRVFKGVPLQINQGKFVAVMGPSDSGKTTLLNCISCYIPFNKEEGTFGNIRLQSLNKTEFADVRNRKLGFVFQDFMLLDGLSIWENIMLPRIIAGKADQTMEQSADSGCAGTDQ